MGQVGCRLLWSLPRQRPILSLGPCLDEVTAGLVLPQKLTSHLGQHLFTRFLEPTRRPTQAWAFPPGLSPPCPSPRGLGRTWLGTRGTHHLPLR